jgi:hypothetical protein
MLRQTYVEDKGRKKRSSGITYDGSGESLKREFLSSETRPKNEYHVIRCRIKFSIKQIAYA